MTEVWQWAAEVVAEWHSSRRAPRDLIAEDARLRLEPVAVRASVSRMVQSVVGSWRCLEWSLWGMAVPEDLSARGRAWALVLARAVEVEGMPAATASRHLATVTQRLTDFAPVLRASMRIQAIADPVHRFAIRHAMPDWLAERLLRQFHDEADGLATALGASAPRTLRANTLRVTSRGELATLLAAAGIPVRETPHAPCGLVVDGDADLFATECYRRGCFEQQDEASQLAALVVAPPPGGRVLDLCAGSGGKTLALAAAMGNRGEILAADVHRGRLQALRARARRAGATNVRAMAVEERDLGPTVGAFALRADRILVDAPCSGVGSWRRRPEARWSIQETDMPALGALQDMLLDRAADLLQPGARIVYATCSLLLEENQARVTSLLARRPGLEIVRVSEVLGGMVARPIADATGTFLSLRPDRHDADGFFAAVLRRRRAR